MEVLTFNNTPFCSVCLDRKLVIGSWNLCHARFSNGRKHKVMCARIDLRTGSLRFSQVDKFLLVVQPGSGRTLCDWRGGCGKNAASDESTTKVLILGLPDESTGESVASISSCFWEWKPKFAVHYEKIGSENVKSPPAMSLPGFGVGSFYYEKQSKNFDWDYRVWAIDFLGQGLSLPVENPTILSPDGNTSLEKDIYCGDLVMRLSYGLVTLLIPSIYGRIKFVISLS